MNLLLLSLAVCGVLPVSAPTARPNDKLLDEVERRACLFFREQSDPRTGLTCDRARNDGSNHPDVASIASTGYALASLPVAVERRWTSRAEAVARARRTLRFVLSMRQNHGWLYHFVNRETGERVWKCEVSSIDTSLLVAGALACGEYFQGDILPLAEKLYERLDWAWIRTNGGERPEKLAPSMGWKPESGFIKSDWDGFSEAPLIYLLGMGAKRGLPTRSWAAWRRGEYSYAGLKALGAGPIFMHQMPYGYFRVEGMKDRMGYDYWASSKNACLINRRYCMDLAGKRKAYGPNVWGLNACDGPDGYSAYGVPEPEDGTVSPTGALASITYIPDLALAAARTMRSQYGDRIWGRYGFADAFNVDRDWYDRDVIGIDLGMALLAVENHRTGLVWRLMAKLPSTARAFAAAGFH